MILFYKNKSDILTENIPFKETSEDSKIDDKILKGLSNTSNTESSFFDLRTKRGQILFIAVSSAIAYFLTLVPLGDIFNLSVVGRCNTSCPSDGVAMQQGMNPTYWIYGSGGESQWVHVNNVLKRLGFSRVSENESTTADLLW